MFHCVVFFFAANELLKNRECYSISPLKQNLRRYTCKSVSNIRNRHILRNTIVKVIFCFAEAEMSSSEDTDERLIDEDHR